MKGSIRIANQSGTENGLIDFIIQCVVNSSNSHPGNKRFKIDISVTDLSENKRKPTREKDSIKALRKELMDLVREYVFLRDEHKCLICGSENSLVLSHFIAQGSGNVALRSEVVNVTIACNKCNGKMLSASHRNLEFIAAMEEKFGEQVVLMLLRRKNQTVKWGHLDYDRKISYYKELIKDLNDEA